MMRGYCERETLLEGSWMKITKKMFGGEKEDKESNGAEETPKKSYEEELPVVEFLGMPRVKNGFCVVAIKVQGDRVISKEVIGEGVQPLEHALNEFRTACAKRVMFPELAAKEMV